MSNNLPTLNKSFITLSKTQGALEKIGETSMLEPEDKVKDYRLPDSATIAIISC